METGATTVLNKMAWPHELVYTLAGKPAAYQNISIPLFGQGYLITMDSEEGPVRQKMAAHVQELISYAEMYGCYQVRTFHCVWPNSWNRGIVHGWMRKTS